MCLENQQGSNHSSTSHQLGNLGQVTYILCVSDGNNCTFMMKYFWDEWDNPCKVLNTLPTTFLVPNKCWHYYFLLPNLAKISCTTPSMIPPTMVVLGCLLSYTYLKVLIFSRHLSAAFRKPSEISHLHLDVGLCYCFVLHIKAFLFWREKAQYV